MMLVTAGLMVSACAPTPSPQVTPDPTAAATPSASADSSTPEPTAQPGPVESFLAWIDASRAPDVEKACAGLTPELADRMIAEMNSSGPVHVTDCAGMITATAELYRALGQSAEVDVTVQEQTDSAATLFATYVDSGDCGTVVMERSASGWIINELSEECAA
nr:hypothetical protein [Microbacterium oxydans]